MRFGERVQSDYREVRVRGPRVDVYYAKAGGVVETTGVQLVRGRIAQSLAVLNACLPKYVAPVTEAEVMVHV